MKKTNSFIHLIVSKVSALAAMAVLVGLSSAPLFAQTAEVRYAGVFYQKDLRDLDQTVKTMYCDYSGEDVVVDQGYPNRLYSDTSLLEQWVMKNSRTPSDTEVLNYGSCNYVKYIGFLTEYPEGDKITIDGQDYPKDLWNFPLENETQDSKRVNVGTLFIFQHFGMYYLARVDNSKTSQKGGSSTGCSTPDNITGAAWVEKNIWNNARGENPVVDGDLKLKFSTYASTATAESSVKPRNVDKKYKLYDNFYVPFPVVSDSSEQQNAYFFQVTGFTLNPAELLIDVDKNSADNRSFTYADNSPVPASSMSGHSEQNNLQDPWVSSALIEYDQPYPNDIPTANKYPNHCLALCMNVYCNNRPNGGSTYSITFPLQEIKFDIVKYYNQKNLANPDDAPAQRTINLYPNQDSAKCGSYHCPGNKEDGWTCNGVQYYSTDGKRYSSADSHPTNCYSFEDGTAVDQSNCYCSNKVCTYAIFNGDGTTSNGNAAIPFCAAWDGSYDIAGEFGKTNGQFGFRATVATNAPGDQVVTDKIEFNSTVVYPGMNQIPIQVDVTNIHTVRSTPSLVGSITAVSAEPYTYAYRLSKDADVRIAIFDASTDDKEQYGVAGPYHKCGGEISIVSASEPCDSDSTKYTYFKDDEAFAAGNGTEGCCANDKISEVIYGKPADISKGDIVRTLVDWQPRLGEGLKGAEKDQQISEFDSWDGRGDNGLLLPAGNYVVSLQAKAQDEWPGIDFSRAVTRQLSLDPLKLTDIRSVGLNKQSTAYASIQYVATESAKVYWNIYTPGTTFEDVLTNSAKPVGTAPTVKGGTGTLVYSAVENRTGRMNFTSKWDGLCGNTEGCTRTYAKGEKMSDGTTCSSTDTCTETFAFGAPMPDGNYVYALWAEIPYNGCYYNKASGVDGAPKFVDGEACKDETANTKQFTGVKTLKYNTGIISVDRGVVDATIQPVSYSTVGSSPTAYGLDPFIFKYSIARDATAIVKVENTAGVVVKHLTPEDGVTQVAQQMNTLSWDGRDDAGRMVYPGTYMFVVETKDAMFPAVTNRAMAVFPVDMYRVVDVSTTDVYGDSNAKATISYKLSKAMNVQINIYNKDVVIPDYNGTVGEYGSDAAWPPRVCNYEKDKAYMKNSSGAACTADSGCHVDPSTQPKCIYVRDESFTNYPDKLETANSGEIDVRLQPIETMDRSALSVGDGFEVTEEWDALYFYNPNDCTAGTTDPKECKYGMLPDGQYPFFISARSNEPFDVYYYDKNIKGMPSTGYTLTGQPLKYSTETVHAEYLYATEKPVSKINVTRGPVYFLDGSTVVYPNAPQLFNVSSGPVFVPPYEINFSVSRASTVEVSIIALQDNVCTSKSNATTDERNNKAGDVCKFLSTMTIANTSNFDPDIVRKLYWDGTDMNGFYVKPGIYEVRLTARNYPDAGMYDDTVKSITLNADLLKVFDLLEADGYAISQRGTDMRIGYQVSVPMKVAIQILKPGTTIYDYSKGTLRNPTTGKEVQDIREVLVKAIVGIRPATTLIEETWDGTDYAGQEVPDGNYPFRFVTALNSADIDTVTGEIIPGDDSSGAMKDWKIQRVADTYEYQNLHKATVAIGDGRFVCADWEKTVFFYPNPLRNADRGTLEITKMPVPGEVSIKFFNLAGDLVRDSGYTCVDANNYQTTMGGSLSFNPDNNISNKRWEDFNLFPSQRNAALRCRWDRTNQHGKKVARGVYFGLVDFKAKNGREHCQKVVKVLVP